MHSLLRSLKEDRRFFVDMYKAAGGVVFHTIEPAEHPAFWQVIERSLMLIPSKTQIRPDMIPEDGDEQRVDFQRTEYMKEGRVQITRKFLSQAVARTWAFPCAMLNTKPNPDMDPEGQAKLTVFLLHAMQDCPFRSFEHYGILRNQSERKRQNRGKAPVHRRGNNYPKTHSEK